MNDFEGYLQRMGSLHDAEVMSLAWRPSDRVLEIALHDVYANFGGLPEYPGLRTGSLVFGEVAALEMNLEHAERMRIYDITVEEGTVTVLLSPAGRVTLRCGGVSFPE